MQRLPKALRLGSAAVILLAVTMLVWPCAGVSHAKDGGGGSGSDGGGGSGSSGSSGGSGSSGSSGSSGGSGSSGSSGSSGRGSSGNSSSGSAKSTGGRSQAEIVDRAQAQVSGDVVGLRRDGTDYAVKIIDRNGRLVRVRVDGWSGAVLSVEGR